jgi:hypothetical protein
MNRPNPAQSENGFIRIVVILIILLLVFTFAGFNLQDSLTVDSLLSTINQPWERLKIFYFGQLQTPLHNYVVDPLRVLYDLVTRHIINEIINVVGHVIDEPPVWRK